MSTAWFDKDSEDEGEEETTNSAMAFTGKCEFDSESSDEDIFDEEIVETCKRLYIKREESCMVREKHKKTISTLLQKKEKLISTIIGLKEEVTLLKYKLEIMT